MFNVSKMIIAGSYIHMCLELQIFQKHLHCDNYYDEGVVEMNFVYFSGHQ